jgi:hypothetical protein
MTVLSRFGIYSIVGLPLLLSALLVGNGQIQTSASSEAGNRTEVAGTTEIIIGDMNGTELFTSELEGEIPCYIQPDGGCSAEWDPGVPLLDVLVVNMTMKDPNGREFIRFENITVSCSLLEGTPELTHCVQHQ